MVNRSRPARARGLKHRFGEKDEDAEPVAPRAGAWIETQLSRPGSLPGWPSRPARARGLKRNTSILHSSPARSRPARARGLKRIGCQIHE